MSLLDSHLSTPSTRRRVVAVCPRDESSREALRMACEAGFTEVAEVYDADPALAARRAVDLVRSGGGDILMKGLISSDVLLRAVLHRETGLLPPGNTLTHAAVAEIAGYPRLVSYSDAAVIPCPTLAQRRQQTAYLAAICRSMGIAEPRIALIHCSEKADPRHFPYTADYATLAEEARRGDFGPCIVDGPLDVKTSLSTHSMEVKGIHSPIGGLADALLFPDLEAANTFHKTITLFAQTRVACLLCGASVPIVMPSRGDSPQSKYYSLALAAMQTL